MKFTSSIVLALASIAAASPMSISKARQDPISNSINQWLADIQAVNFFLDNILQSTQPSQDAANLLPTVMDEPVQLMTLTSLLAPGDANGLQASINLGNGFPVVPNAVMNIMNAGNNPDIVLANVEVINVIRCNFVLGNIGSLWSNVLFDNGMGQVAGPPGPLVCPGA